MEEGADRTAGTDRRCTVLLVTVYVSLAILVFTEKFGLATTDTRLELVEDPRSFLRSTFTLWSPDASLGELQNQAYGYLFPQGSFFVLLDALTVPGWVAERLWSFLVLLIACEGLRRVARAMALGPWAAALAGLAYGLTPRHVAELGVRSAEILPGAVLPWALLPILHSMNGRRRPRDAALLSAVAFACGGGVNGTATAAPAALLAVFVVWGVVRRHLSPRFAVGWFALIGAVSAWWLLSLVRLGAFSPPFYDFVEDARTTTGTSGFSAVLRGASNWVSYLAVGGRPWWPAGYELSFDSWLVLGSGLVAALGFVGLLRFRGRFRAPLLIAAGLGLALQVAAHTGPFDGPFAGVLQDLLDGPLAPLRNVPKVDPVLRVPLALGLGAFAEDAVRVLRTGVAGRRGLLRRLGALGMVGALLLGLVAMAFPVLSANTRTPGWKEMPAYWTQAADYVARRSEGATWVVPGSGFGIETWGWTMEEPMQVLGHASWVSRTQVPLTPATTLRALSQLESYLETGAGSAYLADMLARLGIDTILVRHDLDRAVSETTSDSLVAVALARSPGIRRLRTFGRVDFGPAIEVYAVASPLGEEHRDPDGYQVRDLADAVTVASSVEDGFLAVGEGLVGPAQPMLVAGTEGWSEPADVVGDGYRRRERAFGRIHDAESAVMAEDEPYHAGRVVPDYPASDGARPVLAAYDGIAGVTASSSRAWANVLGPVHPEEAPWSALDGDDASHWRPAPFQDTVGQWWEVRLDAPRPIGAIELVEPVSALDLDRVTRWRVSAGGVTRTVEPDQFTGRARVNLGGVVADAVRVEVAGAPARRAAVGLAEVRISGLVPTRTLRLPEVPTTTAPDFIFGARQETRSCVTTLLGPDCALDRRRASEEASGIDRTFTVAYGGRWRIRGLAVARSGFAAPELLDPGVGATVTGSSWLGQDPTVTPRMAYDGDRATSWVADPRNKRPSLTVDLGGERTVRRLTALAPAGVASFPQSVRIEAVDAAGNRETRTVSLDGTGRFEPVRATSMTLTFRRRAGADPDIPLGLSELRWGPGRSSVPLDGSASTGGFCGYGPRLVVDGRSYRTRVEGRVGDVLSAGTLAVVPCDGGRTISLAAGEHRVSLEATSQFGPTGLTLLAAGQHRQRDAERSRTVRTLSRDDTEVEVVVSPGQQAILSAPHNMNAGWAAYVGDTDGIRLDPILVDGWAQGWIVPADVSGTIVLVYEPQRGYLVGLVGGLAVLGLVVAAAAWALVRRPLRPVDASAGAAADEAVEVLEEAPPPTSRRRWVLACLAAAVAGWLVAGPVVAAGALAGVVLARWPRAALAVVAVTLAGAVVALALLLSSGPRLPPDALDLVTGAALALGLATAAVHRHPIGRHRR
ncbi:alpha-(1-_3)-arabinofuranosyltransferase family protein [Nocardioides sp. YIM 152588]|uniref:alpha-(1->3)-arabinofuranosyltransferase domain-containing protein n=1 Tax=Nocardioides sp. YIM 152588 TaxID=3158259 RepID=UPI0032E4CC2B